MPDRTITEPGVYDGIPDYDYHADPVEAGSLSSTELRRLTDSPARFHWHRTHPQPPKDAFDFGRAAHLLVLGAGIEVAVIPYDSWRTNAAKDARDEARANFQTPILEADWQIVVAMADALRIHPIAAALLDPARGGKPEQTIAWRHRYDVGTEPVAPDFDARSECGGGLHLSPTTGQATTYRSDASRWVRVEVPVGEIVPIPSLLSGAVAKCKVRTCRVVAEVDRDGREIAR